MGTTQALEQIQRPQSAMVVIAALKVPVFGLRENGPASFILDPIGDQENKIGPSAFCAADYPALALTKLRGLESIVDSVMGIANFGRNKGYVKPPRRNYTRFQVLGQAD